MKLTYYAHDGITEISPEELPQHLTTFEGAVWVDMQVTAEEGVTLLREVFRFHELAIEDVLNQEQRPKAEEFADYLFIILNPVTFTGGNLKSRELDVFVGKNYVVTAHLNTEPIIAEAQRRIIHGKLPFDISATYLLYTLLDSVVDSYLPVLESIENELDELGNQLLDRPDRGAQTRMFQLKDCLNTLWWITWPQKDILSLLINHDRVFIDPRSQYYVRDVDDHLSRVTQGVQAARETITGFTNLYVTAVSNQLNMAVNRLTVITVMVGVMAVITGFYGMNFEHTLPPFDAAWGVPFVVVVMGAASATIYGLIYRR